MTLGTFSPGPVGPILSLALKEYHRIIPTSSLFSRSAYRSWVDCVHRDYRVGNLTTDLDFYFEVPVPFRDFLTGKSKVVRTNQQPLIR